ncbi:MAG: hypothetical protein AB1578_00280 [Thermodesulfobacteriota bacterium]
MNGITQEPPVAISSSAPAGYVPLAAACLALALLWSAAVPPEAGAIAAWTREYNTECTTCHTPFPHRNEFGEAFRRNGYVWPGRTPADKPVNAPEGYWLSGIPTTLPLSVSARFRFDYDPELEDDKVTSATDLQLHAGGSIRNKIGFFAHDLTGSAEAFAVYRHLQGTPINLRFGRLIPQTTLWRENQGFTASLQAPLAFSVAGGGGPLTAPRDAVELNAVLAKRLFLAAGVGDRRGQDTMEFFGHLSCKIGGADFLGNQPDVDFDVDSLWDFLSLTLSTYGYGGRIEQNTYDTDFYRIGAEAEVLYRAWTVLFSGVFGHDDDVDGNGLEVDSVVWMGEVNYFFAPNYSVTLRYENEDVGNAPDGIVKRVIGNVAYIPFETVILRFEGRYVRSQSDDDPTNVGGLFQTIIHF